MKNQNKLLSLLVTGIFMMSFMASAQNAEESFQITGKYGLVDADSSDVTVEPFVLHPREQAILISSLDSLH